MHKIIILALGFVVSFSTLAQKKELKGIEKKLINSGKIPQASKALAEIESAVKGTEYESYYFFLQGKNEFGNKKKFNYVKAVSFFQEVIKAEQNSKEENYTEKTISYLNKINNYYFNKVTSAISKNNYSQAGKFYESYSKAFPGRRDLLVLTLYSYQQAKDKTKKAILYERLLKLDRKETSYSATNKQTKRVEEFFKKEERDMYLAIKTHTEAKDIKLDSKTRIEYYNNLVRIYDEKGEKGKTLKTLASAKKEFPENAKFFKDYATVIYKSGDKKAYISAAEDVLKFEPKNRDMWFNLAIVNQELKLSDKAIEAYDKVIEIDPKYRGAYVNKGLIIMGGEAAIITELNQNLKNKKKYNVVKKKLDAIYEKAIPVFEKAHALKSSEGVKATLVNLYNGLGQKEKAAALK